MRKVNISEKDGKKIALVESDTVAMYTYEDALDILGDCMFNGVEHIIIRRENVSPEFFDLKTGIAGDILQKFTTYKTSLAIVGDFGDVKSKSLRDFIRESNSQGRIIFLDSIEDAVSAFTGNPTQ